ncbi:hypothetical protein [Delftia lacustris]|uniref:hypothetical protein n=1 Tax=Delftia lacustris TaxID=558537 RepID=UPI003B979DE9
MTTTHAFQPAQSASLAGAARVLPQLQGVWRGDGWQQALQQRVQPSGHALLDAQLPGGAGRWAPWSSCCSPPMAMPNGRCCCRAWRP